MSKNRGVRPSGEATSGAVAMQGTPKSGPLGYAISGQLVTRPRTYASKPKFSKSPGKYSGKEGSFGKGK